MENGADRWLTPHSTLSSVLRDVEGVDSNLASRSNCWQDVVNAIEAAKTQDSAKAEKSSMRARLRKLGPEISMLESLATMIPDQNGLSVLRGALVTMFKVSGHWPLDFFPFLHVRPTGSLLPANTTHPSVVLDGDVATRDSGEDPRGIRGNPGNLRTGCPGFQSVSGRARPVRGCQALVQDTAR